MGNCYCSCFMMPPGLDAFGAIRPLILRPWGDLSTLLPLSRPAYNTAGKRTEKWGLKENFSASPHWGTRKLHLIILQLYISELLNTIEQLQLSQSVVNFAYQQNFALSAGSIVGKMYLI